VGLGAGGLHAEEHAGRTQQARCLAPSQTRAEIRGETAGSISMYYAQSSQENPPNPAVCHGTLRLPPWGGHCHLPRFSIGTISLYHPYT